MMSFPFLSLLLLYVPASAYCYSSPNYSQSETKRQASGATAVAYEQFLVDTLIVSRYAVTSITSVVRNDDLEQSKELEFRVQLPETAFISNFSM